MEAELRDLETWLSLGLVPKRDVARHHEEVESLRVSIEEEKRRLDSLKDYEEDEYILPKRNQQRAGYQEPRTFACMDGDDVDSVIEDEGRTREFTVGDEDDANPKTYDGGVANDEGDGYGGGGRWREIADPDADEW